MPYSSKPAEVVMALGIALVLGALCLAIAKTPPQQCPGPDCPDCPPTIQEPGPWKSVPPLDLPQSLRQSNYGGGSCMYASLISVLRWQGRYESARWLRGNYSGAQDVDDLAGICNRAGWEFAYTTGGDARFLEWCSRTRRGAAIHYFSNHAITFCGYRDGQAVLLDNNRPGRLIRVPKAKFLQAWRGYGGRALTVVYSPAPPRPWV